MYGLTIKNWFDFRHLHFGGLHSAVTWVSRMVHDRRFWAALVIGIFFVVLVGLSIWGALTQPQQGPTYYPYYPRF